MNDRDTHGTPGAPPARSHGRPDRAWLDAELERLELLIPGLDHAAARGLVPTALAYVERYRGDALQLGHQWDLLVAAAFSAWRAGQHAAVVHLVAGLALPAGRQRTLVEVESLLRLGLAANRHLGDAHQHASLSMHLGCLLFAHGRLREGQRIWHAGARLAQSKDGTPCPWEPLATFALVADLLEDQATAQRFTEAVLRGAGAADTDSATGALFLRGLHARRQWDLDRAYADLSHCVRLLAREAPVDGPLDPSGLSNLSPQRQLFLLAAQTELARVEGDDARACDYAETAIAVAQAFAGTYTVAVLLIDQARYAYRYGRFPAARSAYHRLREAARETLTLPIAQHADRFLAHEMASILSADLAREESRALVPPAGATSSVVPREQPWIQLNLATRESLSEREADVLRLVSAGLANKEIAERLVVTPGTVKKHLEHIYAKLGAHNRTAAVAAARVCGVLP